MTVTVRNIDGVTIMTEKELEAIVPEYAVTAVIVCLTENEVERIRKYAEAEEVYQDESGKLSMDGAVGMLALKGLAQWEQEAR